MNLRRYLNPESIRLELRTRAMPEDIDPDEDFEIDSPRNLQRVREEALEEIVELFDAAGKVSNARRLHRDLCLREKKAPTALGQGIALPHVRTLQIRGFAMAFCRSEEGLPFAAEDGEPVKLFFAMAAPPHDDRTYLKVYRRLATLLLDTDTRMQLESAQDPSEILYLLKTLE